MGRPKKFDETQLLKAVEALQQHLVQRKATKKPQLLQDDPFVCVVVTLKKVPQNPPPLRPNRILLPHSFNVASETEVCLFTKDDKPTVRKLLDAKGVRGVTKVIPFSKVLTHFKTFEQRRQLATMYDLYLADSRIGHVLPQRLGKSFQQRKSIPYPINLKKSNLKVEFEQVLSSTHFRIGRGTTFTVKIGRLSMPSHHLVENIVGCMDGVADRVPKGWKNILTLCIKTSSSVALPIFNSLPIGASLIPPPGKLPAKTKVEKLEAVEEKEVAMLSEQPVPPVDKVAASPPKAKRARQSLGGSYSVKKVKGSRVLVEKKKKERKRRSL